MINGKRYVIININSQKVYNEVMSKLKNMGYEWNGGTDLTGDLDKFKERLSSNGSMYVRCLTDTHTVVHGNDWVGTYTKSVTIDALDFIGKRDPIVIYRKGNNVIAIDKESGKNGVAKCHPDDEFDFSIGAKIAFDRLMGTTENKPSDKSSEKEEFQKRFLKFKIGDDVVLNPNCKIGENYGGVWLSNEMAKYGQVFKITELTYSIYDGGVHDILYKLSDNIYSYAEEMLMPASEAIKVGDKVVLNENLKIEESYSGIVLLDTMACFGTVMEVTNVVSPGNYQCNDKYIYSAEMLKTEEDGLKIGDKVMVTNNGESFPLYYDWVDKNVKDASRKVRYNFDNSAKNGMVGTVIAIAPHGRSGENLVYISDDKTMLGSNCYLIGINGVKKVYEF